MQIELELLAPAKNKSIGIAAIDCGADAVYIAGPKFGAREAAGNSISDISELVEYAHKFGAKVYMVVNTILYQEELQQAKETIIEAYKIGCDAIIVQDLAIMEMDLPPIELFASTQTNIRTPEQARFLESLGFSRLILARELSTAQIAAIKDATSVPLESFVHGALCVSYSGQCYLSQKITGRSANRGCCAQACRNSYTLVDSTGRELKRDSHLLSLKDLNLSNHIPELVKAGITSFKIEGRLKNESYIKNTVLLYRRKIDEFLKRDSNYRRASYGYCRGGFTPDPSATFNRGYTTLFIDGTRGRWNSTDGAKYIGEPIGEITSTGKNKYGQAHFTYKLKEGKCKVQNGDGLCFVTPEGNILGARANTCNGNMVATTEKLHIPAGSRLYRNYNIAFEKELEKNMPSREIAVKIALNEEEGEYRIYASTDEGIKITHKLPEGIEPAQNQEMAAEGIRKQLGKRTGIFSFSVESTDVVTVPFLPASVLNGIRREMAEMLSLEIKKTADTARRKAADNFMKRKSCSVPQNIKGGLSYLANCANTVSEQLYTRLGAVSVAPAYELREEPQAELMRTKYCIKYELGICPNFNIRSAADPGYRNNLGRIAFTEPLYLLNGKNRFRLKFNCAECEMLVIG